MTVKHDLKHLAWVYNHTEDNKLTLLLYHRVLASLLTGKQTDKGMEYQFFISKNDLVKVVPEFGEIDSFLKKAQFKFKVKKALNEMFEQEFTIHFHGYYYEERFIVDGIVIIYIDND